MPYFALIRGRGPAWNWSLPMRAQNGFAEHAAFMDALVDEGFILAGGPLGGEDDAPRVLHIIEASSQQAVEDRIAQDPWGTDMLETVSLEPFTVLLGKLR